MMTDLNRQAMGIEEASPEEPTPPPPEPTPPPEEPTPETESEPK